MLNTKLFGIKPICKTNKSKIAEIVPNLSKYRRLCSVCNKRFHCRFFSILNNNYGVGVNNRTPIEIIVQNVLQAKESIQIQPLIRNNRVKYGSNSVKYPVKNVRTKTFRRGRR